MNEIDFRILLPSPTFSPNNFTVDYLRFFYANNILQIMMVFLLYFQYIF